VTQQNAASAEELSATMAMFKVEDHQGQVLVEDLSSKKSVKKLPHAQHYQAATEKILPLKEDDFV
jgi:hypothetical protein